MILFTMIAIGIFSYTIFAKDYLIDSIKNLDKYNQCVKEKIMFPDTWDFVLGTKYNENDYNSVGEIILEWIICNIFFNFINFIIVAFISILVVSVYPKSETQYSFNINSLRDNVVTSGEIHGSAFCARGSIDGEISYFFCRTTSKGEIIEHIPSRYSYIKYDDELKPHIEVHQTTHKFPNWLQKILWVEFLNSTNTEYHVIVVPEGTISVDGTYEIDME